MTSSAGRWAQYLEEEGFEVSQAATTGEAVAYLMARDTEMILMSERMSTIDGLALLPLLRRLSPAPVLVMGDGSSAAVAHALTQGAIGYLDRPSDLQELLDRVVDLL